MSSADGHTAPQDKHLQLLKCSDEISRLNAKIIETCERHREEMRTLIAENDRLYAQCQELLAAYSDAPVGPATAPMEYVS